MKKLISISLFLLVPVMMFLATKSSQAQTVCPEVVLQGGRVTLSVDIASEGTYKVWSRMKAGNTTGSNAFYIQIDNNCPTMVGGSGNISSNDWTWVDFRGDFETQEKIEVTLTSGNHAITLIGGDASRVFAGVSVDKLLLTKDLSCVPTDFGDNCPADGTITPTPEPPGEIEAYIEANGGVVMEAEGFDSNITRGDRWDGPRTILADSVGGYMSALPDDGTQFLSPGFNKGPEMVYNINFTSAGDYFVWLRSSGPNADGDSAHVGLDEVTSESVQSMALYNENEGNTPWEWRDKNNDGSRTKVSVTTPGIHYFHIYMIEDGTRVDRIHLTKDSAWTPNTLGADGPSVSQRGTFSSTTPTPGPNKTVLNFGTIKLHGIGKAGDNQNPTSGGNISPLTTTKKLLVEFYDGNENLIKSAEGDINYSANTGYFSGNINADIAPGNYIIKVVTHKYLKEQLPGIISISTSTINQMPDITLRVGDINSDARLSILDYSILIGCFSDLLPAKDCDDTRKFNSDITDDGNVNLDDNSLLFRESS